MCMNCGCGEPNQSHGNPANITADMLQRAGEANDQSMRESAQHIIEAVEQLDASQGADKGQGLAKPAAASGGTEVAARGTPATES